MSSTLLSPRRRPSIVPLRAAPRLAVALLAGLSLAGLLAGCGEPAGPAGPPEPMTGAEFRRELVGLPLCGKPRTGPLAGKPICTVHHTDGTAVLAGSGIVAQGRWELDGDRVCRRDAVDTPDLRRCVRYERLAGRRYRNSDDVEFCIGPCP
ncbi:hypothetical protein PQJ75_09060 [Rhodoplanes sp. TEM]|uniref:Lipoprotein n=1 Tax=Rhodoplanes tepidamans TaxID=200616 RepID=A0ABT5JD30_RHOTP|nr:MULTISPECIES: hypothetical protein [Rhodoplanes]MDC7787532.1 hypothetical protein [Rhodoplanes tepidamans]MDC7983877.1 hypothetical protein [Rhodoplanes sp. TEM]MDQ0354315.1 hypothetical protein [Rhodoplanes tepidamans]